MFALRSSPWAFRLTLTAAFASCPWGSAAAQGSTKDREKLISWFRHQEGLVKSMKAELENVFFPTTSEQAAAIRKVLHEWKDDDRYDRVLMTPQKARNLSYVQQWWSKGQKVRFHSFYHVDFDHLGADLSQLSPDTTLAYDGQIVRTLSLHDKTHDDPTASIQSEQSSNWMRLNPEDPFSMLYGYYEVPYSRLVQEAATFHSTSVNRDGKRLFQVSFTCSGDILGKEFLVLLFDEQHRLVERQEFVKESPTKTKFLRKQILSDYRPHPDPSGETIWFPYEATYRGYWTHSNGIPVEVSIRKVRVRNLQFNFEIADDFFELNIPKNARIYDGVTGRGWLPEGERPDFLFPAEAKATRWTWIAIGTFAAALVLFLAFIVIRRRRNAGRIAASPGGH